MAASVSIQTPMPDSIMAALQGGDHAGAAAAARDLLAREPDNTEALHLLALASRQLGDIEAAGDAIERAVTLAPENANYQITRAMIATQRHDASSARDAFDAALKQDPNQLVAYVGLAQIALATRDLAAAEQHLRYAERLQPDHPQVVTIGAQLALARGEPQLALGMLGRAADAAPNDILVQGTYGLALLSQRHFAFAEQALRKAIGIAPQTRGLRHGLIQALIAQKRLREAEAEADALIALGMASAQSLMLKGQLAAARGARAEAEPHLLRALELQPNLLVALDALLRLWVPAGERERAEACVESLLERSPRNDGLWAALLELQRANPQRAVRTTLRWQEARPDHAHANELAAQVCESERDFGRANELAALALSLDPKRVRSELVLARSELREGRATDARARIERLLEAPPPALRRTLLGWLGRACDLAGDAEAAVAAWRAGQALIEGATAPPAFVLPDAALAAATDAALEQRGAADPAAAPRLLWGAPGSGVERVVDLLSGRDDVRVLLDRFGASTRNDGFRPGHLQRKRAGTPEQQAARFAKEWRDGLMYARASAQDIDWLPHLDARVLPPLLGGLPDARLVVVLRDPRDMLLNWLGFGTPHGHAFGDPVASARWLALALEQFLFARERRDPSLLVVRMRELEEAPARVAAEIAQFTGGTVPNLEIWERGRLGLGDLPRSFAPGHWRQYETALGAAFDVLEPVAARLGVD